MKFKRRWNKFLKAHTLEELADLNIYKTDIITDCLTPAVHHIMSYYDASHSKGIIERRGLLCQTLDLEQFKKFVELLYCKIISKYGSQFSMH